MLCTNPAALGGGSAPLDAILPSAPFAPGTTIGAATTQLGFPAAGHHAVGRGRRSLHRRSARAAGGANVLQIAGTTPAPPSSTPLPDATWGLHLTDANIALGNIITVVTGQARRYVAQTKTTN